MDYQVLKTELTTDPLTRGYSTMTDLQAADDINTVYRGGAEGGISEMVKYLATHDNRSNEGGDTNATLMLGRLKTVANSEPYTDPFHRAGVWEAGGSGTNEQIALSATGNTITFGSAHDITSLDAKDAIRLSGTTADDGVYQIVSVSLQVVTVTSITVTETLERAMRVFKIQDAKNLTNEQVQNARGILELLLAPSVGEITFDNTEIDLAFQDMEVAEVWKSADTTALNNFSLQSRGEELSLGFVREGDVAFARSL